MRKLMSEVKRYIVPTLPGRLTRDCVEVVAASDFDALRAALQEIFNVGPLGVDTYAVCWKRIHAIADEALHGPAAANAAPHGNAGDVSVPSDAQGSAYKAAVPFGEMGQIATPHDGGQTANEGGGK